jgi:hypothetical protein
MPRTLLRVESHDVLPFPLPDETLSSWIERQDGVVCLSESRASAIAAMNGTENDYGELDIRDPSIDRVLAARLKLIARWPAPFLRRPSDRKAVCWQCWRDEWSQGKPLYRSRQWTFAWRSVCPRHRCALTFSEHIPHYLDDWPIEQISQPVRRHEVMELHPLGYRIPLSIDLFHDCRAVYLEEALEDISTSEWQPRGFDQVSLHRAYAIISWLLQLEFGTKTLEDAHRQQFWGTGVSYIPGLPVRKRLLMEYWSEPRRLSTRHMNILAEAILSAWTNTPLPRLSAERTAILVKIAGWEIGGSRLPLHRRIDPALREADHWFHLDAGGTALANVANCFPEILRARLRNAIRNRVRTSAGVSLHEQAMRTPSVRLPEPNYWFEALLADEEKNRSKIKHRRDHPSKDMD